MLNNRIYNVIFPGEYFQQYVNKVIAENLFSKFDGDMHTYQLLE